MSPHARATFVCSMMVTVTHMHTEQSSSQRVVVQRVARLTSAVVAAKLPDGSLRVLQVVPGDLQHPKDPCKTSKNISAVSAGTCSALRMQLTSPCLRYSPPLTPRKRASGRRPRSMMTCNRKQWCLPQELWYQVKCCRLLKQVTLHLEQRCPLRVVDKRVPDVRWQDLPTVVVSAVAHSVSGYREAV